MIDASEAGDIVVELDTALNFFRHSTFRKYQRELIVKIIQMFNEGKRCVLVDAPTGLGKTDVNACIAQAFEDAFYVVGVKQLEDQILKDFPNFADIRGRSNYQCLADITKTCEDGICTVDRKWRCGKACHYKAAKDIALNSDVVVTNIWYFILEGGRMFKNRELLILDEAHGLTEQLIQFSKVIISPRTVFSLFNQVRDMKIEDMIPVIGERVDAFENQSFLTEDEVKRYRKMRSVLSKLENLKDEYIEDRKSNARIIIPLYCNKSAEMLFKRADYVLMTSATLNKNLMVSELGIRDYFDKDYVFMSVPGIFDPINRPLYCMPVCSFTMKNQTQENIEGMRNAIKVILSRHTDERGIIFVNGYRYMDMLRDISDRIIFHDSKNRGEVLKHWLGDLTTNKVLVGVGMEEGLDLKEDLARFSVILKAPFPDASDPRVKARLYRKQWNWFNLITQQRLSQAYGRIIRSEEDTGSIYVLDQKAIELLTRKGTPKWIKDAMITLDQTRLKDFY